MHFSKDQTIQDLIPPSCQTVPTGCFLLFRPATVQLNACGHECIWVAPTYNTRIGVQRPYLLGRVHFLLKSEDKSLEKQYQMPVIFELLLIQSGRQLATFLVAGLIQLILQSSSITKRITTV